MKIVVTERAEMGSRMLERSVEITPDPADLHSDTERPMPNLSIIARKLHEELSKLKYEEAK